MSQQTTPVYSPSPVLAALDELSRIDETASALEEFARLLIEDGGNMGPVGHLANTIAEVLIAHTRAASLLLDGVLHDK
jgi:hypothetical protein